MSFFICLLDFWLKFSHIAVSRKRLQMESNTDLTTTALFIEYFVGMCPVSSTLHLHGLKIAKVAQFLFFFWRHQVFSIVGLRRILVCSLNMLVLFSCKFLQYRLISFSVAMRIHFLSFYVCQSSSPGSYDELSLWLLVKTN